MEDIIIYKEGNHKSLDADEFLDKLLKNTDNKQSSGCTQVNITDDFEEADKHKLVIKFADDGVSLISDGQTIMGDFGRMLKRVTHNNLSHEMIVKAAKIKNHDYKPLVVDATAGMGEDSFLLAAAGFNVKMYERDVVVAALLKDTIRRAMEDEILSKIVCNMELIEEDSIVAMTKLDYTPDIVVLDPMFPERQKSGLVKKKFQLIHLLEKPCFDEEELLQAAVGTGAGKIIVKRPIKGPYLGNVKPSYSIEGKVIRYDCIVR